MAELYQLITPGTAPVTIEEAKAYLRLVDSPEATDDALLQLMLDAATEFAESYVRLELRANTWTLTIDSFSEYLDDRWRGHEICDQRILLRRAPVASITSVTRLIAGVPTAVAASVYYLKKLVNWAEVVLAANQVWPTSPATDDREQAIVVTFVTAPHRALEQIKLGILRHLAYLWENRGDCPDACGTEAGRVTSALLSGAAGLYDQHRVPRI